MGDSAWFCGFDRCQVAYFNLFETTVTVEQLVGPVFPMDPRAPVCACFGLTLAEIEADVIRLAIGHYRGRMTEVARRLGIGRSTLYRKLAELGIDSAA